MLFGKTIDQQKAEQKVHDAWVRANRHTYFKKFAWLPVKLTEGASAGKTLWFGWYESTLGVSYDYHEINYVISADFQRRRLIGEK